MASAKQTLIAANLVEDFSLGLAALPAGEKRVDREKKVLYGVRMLGLSSPNTHDVEGVDGTDYDLQAIREGAHLYEGLPGYADHPPRNEPNKERSVYDALGIHRNVRATPEGLVSDFHIVPHHKLCESILDSAENENLTGLYAFSHNARGQGEVRGRRYVVTKITEARSGDIVAKGASTRNLFESARPAMPIEPAKKTTLGKVTLESKIDRRVKAVLLEMDDLMAAEVSEPVADGNYKDDLAAAVSKLLQSEDPADHELVKKIAALLRPDKAESLEEECEPDKDKPADDDKDKAMKESREEAKALLQVVGLKAEGPLLEAVAGVSGLKAKLAIVNELKAIAGAAPAKSGTKPPPGPPRSPDKAVRESAAPNCDDLMSMPLR